MKFIAYAGEDYMPLTEVIVEQHFKIKQHDNRITAVENYDKGHGKAISMSY
jgi:hypothetical protein